jgi:TnpA family transposase
MSRWEQLYYGHENFPALLTELEIERFFTPSPAEMEAILQRRAPANRIAFALQLGFLKMTGRTLNSVELVPPAVLAHLGRVTGREPPRIASIRAFYRRRRTLFDHQTAVRALLGRRELLEYGERGLTAFPRREAASLYEGAALVEKAQVWLIDHGYLLPAGREIRRQAVRALRHQERILSGADRAAVDDTTREAWAKRLLEAAPDGNGTVLEWLSVPPAAGRTSELDGHLSKIHFLRELGAGRLGLDGLPLAGLEHFHRRIASRKPAALLAVREPRRTLELACFPRLQLMRLSDTALELADRQIAAQWRQARERAEEQQRGRLRRFRTLLADLTVLANEAELDAGALREKLRALIVPFEPELENTPVLATRRALSERAGALARLVKTTRAVGLDLPADHKLETAFAALDRLADARELPAGEPNPFGRSWRTLIDQPDRPAALKSYTAAAAMLLKRSLNNRSATAADSLAHKSAEARLIPEALWRRDRRRYLRGLSIPENPAEYLQRIEAALAAGMVRLAAGRVLVDEDGAHLPRRKPAPKDPAIERARRLLTAHYGAVQLPDVMIDVDNNVRFSWALLGRPARSAEELATLYTALLALGSDLTAAGLDRMVPGVGADMLEPVLRRLEAGAPFRAASDAVAGFMRRHPVAGLWGSGVQASADMMSLDATRHLWNARLDPRRKGPAVGTYPHVLDQWPVFYDQPIVLGRWQAGAAIEGALRQTMVEKLERVAVDTHGFTHFSMATGKFCGFDLCPRLAGIRTRKLYLPAGYGRPVPDALKPIVAQETVSPRTAARGWDGFARLCASIKEGWYPAPDALEQYGSASSGDPVHATGTALGKLLRSIYLCDYFSSPEFRNGILDLLNQGEAVHSLQRAIHPGAIGARHGRSAAELQAVSGALTLLTNIVMAWNTARIQSLLDKKPDEFPDSVASHVAPTAHAHINMRGIITFRLERAARGLIVPARSPADADSLTKAD